MKFKKYFKELLMWFITKKVLIKELSYLNLVLDKRFSDFVNNIKELDQNKLYIIQSEDISEMEVILIKDIIKKIQNKVQWTLPEIIIMNRKIEELDLSKLELIIKKYKKNKGE